METLQKQLVQMTYVEIAGVITGLIAVYLAVKNSIWTYPWGIVNVLLYAYFFLNGRLYSDAGLQIYFLLMQFYGWEMWARGGTLTSNTLPVARLPKHHYVGWMALTLSLAVLLGYLMDTYTDAALPYADAFAAAISITAQYFQSRKMIECWILWIGVNALYIGYIYPVKGYYLTMFFYFVLLLLAIRGLQEWRHIYKQQTVRE